MPSRKHKLLRKVECDEVQGKGSWVLVKAPTLEDVRNVEMPDKENGKSALDFGVEMLGVLVKDWNWVDDEDKPLPKPNQEVIAELPYQEIQFLMGALGLEQLADQKN